MKRTSGFSLLELMVALLFMGLLLSGMIRVYVAALKGWNRVNESLTAQRALRWAMDRVAEDLRMMGYLFPPPELRSLEVAASADPTLQSSFMLVPGRPGGGTEDELSFVMDLPVPVQAVLERAIAGSGPEGRTGPGAPAEVRVRLQAGDLFLVAGDRFEFAQVAVPVELPAARAGPVAVVHADGAGGAAFAFPHGAGAPVQVVRPLRVVRYAVVPLPLESGPGPVPCLVRFETAYPRDRAVPAWGRLLKSAGSHEVVAANVTRFRVDFTPDQVFPGIRGADYRSTVGNLNARLKACHGRDGAATDPLDPFWFRRFGGLIKVDLEIGSPVPREEYAPPGAAPGCRRQLLRGQTLLLAPRNFGL